MPHYCVTQHMARACSDTANDIPFLQSCNVTHKNLFIYVSGSGIRVKTFELVACNGMSCFHKPFKSAMVQ